MCRPTAASRKRVWDVGNGVCLHTPKTGFKTWESDWATFCSRPAVRHPAGIPRRAFDDELNDVLADGRFDVFAKELGEPLYVHTVGRSCIPLGACFRMLFASEFEGIDSGRSTAWRCADDESRSCISLKLGDRHGIAAAPQEGKWIVIDRRKFLKLPIDMFCRC